MPKKGKGRVQVVEPVYGSDDERRYEKDPEPDQDDDDYFYDDVDKFHMQKEKMLLDQGVQDDENMDSESEGEVLGVGGDSDDDLLSDDDLKAYKKQLRRIKLNRKKSDMGSDLEDQDEEGEPDHTTYGKKVQDYYNADFSDDNVDLSGSEDEEGAAALEEKEALALQKRINAELDDQDFGLDMFKEKKLVEAENEEEKITQDLTKLSRKEKLQLLKKESPEMLTLIDDYKSKMTEVRDIFMPLLRLVREGKIQGKAGDYVETKTKLHLNYCTNISFYMMMKSKQIAVHNHPVIKRLVQYRNLMKELEPLDNQLKEEMTDILDRLKKGEEVEFSSGEEKKQGFVRRKSVKSSRQRVENKKLSQLVSESDDDEEDDDVEPKAKNSGSGRYETEEEKAALEYYRMMKGAGSKDNEEMDSGAEEREEAPEVDNEMEEGEEEEEGKRAITFQIAKNKGMTPKRKKEQRNPRVKNKLKYRKAKIRRKGQVREARTEMARYGGEISGIRAGVKRGIKMKV
ncbi:something about silencing protein 10-like [Mizuhopecten yessoensis]|uniref:Something about silencing protein 10 n=1 Tax=Mizuhopecten yessoensis TaxID=6573 RepID=A0A210PWI1_MIZYE|nr:something about silencing protein 10-like [Mizuhopecten yessoensis]OWF40834.1 Something about silencing protein 10 [Mizuhopecten yessoensis]